MRSHLPLLALSLTAVAGVASAQAPLFSVAGSASAVWAYNDGTKAFTTDGNFFSPTLGLLDRSKETFAPSFRLPSQSQLFQGTPDGKYFVIVRLVDGFQWAEVRDAANALITREQLTGRTSGPTELSSPFISPDQSTLFFYVPNDPENVDPDSYDFTTYYRPFKSGTMKSVPGLMFQIAPGVGGYKPAAGGAPKYVTIPAGANKSVAFTIPADERPVGGDGTWVVSTKDSLVHARFTKYTGGTTREYYNTNNDQLSGYTTGNRAFIYRHNLGKIMKIDLNTGAETAFVNWVQTGFTDEDRLYPSVSPDGKYFNLPVNGGQDTLIDFTGKTIRTLYSRIGLGIGFTSGGRPFIAHSGGAMTWRNPTGTINRTLPLGLPSTFRQLSANGGVAITQVASAIYRQDPTSTAAAKKWFTPSADAQLYFAPDAKSAFQDKQTATGHAIRWWNDVGTAKNITLPFSGFPPRRSAEQPRALGRPRRRHQRLPAPDRSGDEHGSPEREHRHRRVRDEGRPRPERKHRPRVHPDRRALRRLRRRELPQAHQHASLRRRPLQRRHPRRDRQRDPHRDPQHRYRRSGEDPARDERLYQPNRPRLLQRQLPDLRPPKRQRYPLPCHRTRSVGTVCSQGFRVSILVVRCGGGLFSR
ncbi:hypothetical protein EON79_07640 [bacterium]|nr:MAG: hypothetical protein EON79_07640 [bacterium]